MSVFASRSHVRLSLSLWRTHTFSFIHPHHTHAHIHVHIHTPHYTTTHKRFWNQATIKKGHKTDIRGSLLNPCGSLVNGHIVTKSPLIPWTYTHTYARTLKNAICSFFRHKLNLYFFTCKHIFKYVTLYLHSHTQTRTKLKYTHTHTHTHIHKHKNLTVHTNTDGGSLRGVFKAVRRRLRLGPAHPISNVGCQVIHTACRTHRTYAYVYVYWLSRMLIWYLSVYFFMYPLFLKASI